MFKLETHHSFVSVPKTCLLDDTLSFGAKGLYAIIFANDGKCEVLSDEASKYLEELVSKGYIVQRRKDYMVKTSPVKLDKPEEDIPFETSTKPEEKVVVKKDNRFDKIKSKIESYTEDTELRKALLDYFIDRLRPPKGSRFDRVGSILPYQVDAILESLNGITGNKIEAVKYAHERQYYKFFDIPKKKSLDGVVSGSYTDEDMRIIEERLKNMERVF